MNDSSQWQDLAKNMLEMLKSTSQFVLDQAPDVIQQLILYERVKHAVEVALIVAGVWLAVLAAKQLATECKKSIVDQRELIMAGLAISLIGGAVTIPLLFIEAIDGMKWWLAPKIALVEYLGHIVK